MIRLNKDLNDDQFLYYIATDVGMRVAKKDGLTLKSGTEKPLKKTLYLYTNKFKAIDRLGDVKKIAPRTSWVMLTVDPFNFIPYLETSEDGDGVYVKTRIPPENIIKVEKYDQIV